MDKEKNGSHSAEAAGCSEVYSNQFSLGWTGRDIRILFSQLIVAPDDPAAVAGERGGWSNQRVKLLAEDRAAVTTSWSDAKVLAGMLVEAIERFETLNGVIVQPMCPGAEPGPPSSPPHGSN
jgi:hypothetical protein